MAKRQSTRSLTARSCARSLPERLPGCRALHGHEDRAIPLRHWTTSGFNSPATPLATLIGGDDIVEALVEDVGAALAPYLGDEGLAFPQEVHVSLASSE